MQPAEQSQTTVLAKIFAYLDQHLPQRPATPLSGRSQLIADLGLDSLQSFEMVADLEDHFGITVPMEALQDITTLDDVARVITRVLEDQPS
jgi:acyl carrier protein